MIIQKKKFQLGTLEFFSSSIQEILSQGSVHISNHFLFSNCNFSPCKGGLLDTKMGALRDDICSTCKKNWKKCPGHFGFMKLCLPVFNIGYIKSLLGILQIICKGCSRVLIPKGPKRENFLKYLRKTRTREESIRIKGIMKLIEKCRNQDFCPFCNSKVGIIKKIGICNFIQEFRFSDDRKKFYSFVDSSIPFFNVPDSNVLDPLKIFHILQKVPFDDLEFFDMDQIRTRPENLLLSFIPVPPIIIRPSIPIGEKLSNEDDLTVKLSEIQQINYQLKKGLFGGSGWFNLKEKWNILQIECARYLNSEIFPKELNSKLVKGLYQRLKGKNGRFRGNLSGKRVDFSGRTVISPDPNMEINKIGVPLVIACHLSFPERVTFFNKKRLERCVMRGVTRYPGANYLINTQQSKIILENFSKLPLRLDIREGFIIERHLKDNDVILFNRQPSLHRISIMAHRIKIMPGKTFRMNECICKPYNADFDGDEMNIHIPQTQKARTEAMVLMHSIINFNTPRNGESQIAATQDFLSTAFVLTSKNQFFSCKTIGKIFGTFLSREERRNIGIPAILKPVFLWTGKQVFSFIVFHNRENFPEKKEFIDLNNFQLKEKFYSLEKTQCSPFFCPYDGWILIRKSQLLAGRIGKSSLGSGIKNSILSLMLASHSFKDVARSLLKISRFTSQWFSGFGFSIGISDISSDQSTMIKKKYILKQGFNLCQTVEKERSKKSQKPEMNKKKIESTLQKILGKLRENLSEFCLKAKNQIQSPISTMVLSGSKGTKLNLIQMISCLGQQSVEGQRVKQGMIFRVFPHFKADIWGFEYSTNGFIKKSFFQGLNPLDFFFHAIAGREGLIDTAVKTAETGYLQRKLIKSLEDVISFFDGSVRTSNGRLLQFNFGDDGFDPNNSFWLRGTPYKKKKVISLFLKNEKNSLTREETDSFSRGHLFLDFGIISFTWKTFGSFKFFGNRVSLENFLDFSFIENYIRMVFARFNLSKVEAGDSVGAIAAQSIGEPGTQMTLQTFHSAGLANFNLNLGIPRVNEILNASKEINFPLVKVRFVNIGRKKDLFNTKLKLEKIFLGEISQKIEIVVGQSEVFIDIFLNPRGLQLLGIFNISKEICKKILKIRGFWKNFNFYISKISGEIRIIPSEINDEPNFSSLKMIKLVNFCKFDLPKLLIHGFSEPIDLMNENSISGTTFFIEGTNLTEILYLETIDFSSIYCSHIFMVLNSLGIEAARKTIISEIKTSFDLHGISTDSRHLSLLADSMTHQGIILGINRHGLGKLKNNTLILASFEKTLDHLFTSAFRTSRDEILGVSENIILGKNLPVGTGTIVLKHLK